MLTIHCHGQRDPKPWNEGEILSEEAEWIDLLDPCQREREAVEALISARLPDRHEITSLGFSGGNQESRRVLSLHAHLYADHQHGSSEPIGMLVTRQRLVTIRFQSSRPFDDALEELRDSADKIDGPALLMLLLNAIANDVAAQMQGIAGDVAQFSDEVFTETNEKTRMLRKRLVRIGQLEGRLARYRISMLGIRRGVSFVQHRAPDWFGDGSKTRVKVLASDLKVLDQFDEQLTGKLQFLQDAVLGFINTDQNSVMKLLTVASVVTIPPVILAGIWGMNFRHMPELDKVWGYPMALSALFLSMALPLLWFGLRGWLSRD